IRCPSTIRQPGLGVTSCPDAIAKAIERVLEASAGGKQPLPIVQSAVPIPDHEPDRHLAPGMTPAQAKMAKFCPECGSKLEHEGGCVTCRNCGYSKCG
ncbi:MAG: ribonucleotide-diphosphate reductase subunit alpha, partial [Angelakisella sp.]